MRAAALIIKGIGKQTLPPLTETCIPAAAGGASTGVRAAAAALASALPMESGETFGSGLIAAFGLALCRYTALGCRSGGAACTHDAVHLAPAAALHSALPSVGQPAGDHPIGLAFMLTETYLGMAASAACNSRPQWTSSCSVTCSELADHWMLSSCTKGSTGCTASSPARALWAGAPAFPGCRHLRQN